MRRFVLCLLLSASAAWARGAGISANGCDNCHSGGPAHTVSIDVPTLSVGGTAVVTVTIRGNSGSAGLFLTASRGTFAAINGEGTRLLNGDLVHSSPKGLNGGQATFRVQFTAPNMPAGVTFSAYSVNANADGRSGGDSANTATRGVAIGCTGTTYYRDFDGDGVGAMSSGSTLDCTRPMGYGDRGGDCDDNDAMVAPGLTERCNGRDDNCNGQSDEGLSSATTWPDADGDGFGSVTGAPTTGCSSMGRATNNRDCDDTKAQVNPSAAEVCNSRDDNCDGRIDEFVRARCGIGWCAQVGATCDPASCMPGSPMTERCNALDDDCDGTVDEDVSCPNGQACIRGQCLMTDVDDGGTQPTVDAGSGGMGGMGGTGGTVDAGGGPVVVAPGADGGSQPPRGGVSDPTCSSSASLVALGVLVWHGRRRRRSSPSAAFCHPESH